MSYPRGSAGRRSWLLIVFLVAVVPISIFTIWRFNSWNDDEAGTTKKTPVPVAERTLSYSLEAQRDPKRYRNSKPFRTFDNIIFGPGDQVRFHISSSQSGYLYVVNEGPTETDGLPNFNLLFPKTDLNTGSPEIPAGRLVQIPMPSWNRKQDWFIFDQEEGIEKIWLVWSERTISKLESVNRRVAPEDRGAIRDAEQRSLIANYLTGRSVDKPEVVRDEGRKVTEVRGKGEILVWVVKLEHH